MEPKKYFKTAYNITKIALLSVTVSHCESYPIRSAPLNAGTYAVESDCPTATQNKGTLTIANPGQYFMLDDGLMYGFPTNLAQTQQSSYPSLLVAANEEICKGVVHKKLIPKQEILFVCFDANQNYKCSIKLKGES